MHVALRSLAQAGEEAQELDVEPDERDDEAVGQQPRVLLRGALAMARSMKSKSRASVNEARPTAKSEMPMPRAPEPPNPNAVFVTMAKTKFTTAKIA